jgi:ATP adenylyltransferase
MGEDATAPPSPCALCIALAQSAEARPLCDTILFESGQFIVMPALGALTVGHVMLVSRAHVTSLAAMGPSGVAEYLDLRRKTSLVSGCVTESLLAAEHGGTTGGSAGGCIDHAHINLMPGLGNLGDALDGVLPLLASLRSPQDLVGLEIPHIWVHARRFRTYDASEAASQLIRRSLCARLDRDDWDWELFRNEPVVASTVRMWSNAEGHRSPAARARPTVAEPQPSTASP